MLTGRLAKWQIILSEFDIVFTSQKAVKGQAIADHLAENPRDNDYQPLRTYFPDERVLFVGATDDISEQSPEWRLFFDGASNSLGAGIGAVLVSPEGKHYPAAAKLQFVCTNNMAEYEACIFGLNMALEMEIKELIAFSDSDLLVYQTLKQWITKDSKILPYHCSLLTLAKQFQNLEFRHLPRARNAFADALATLASMIQYPDELKIEPIQIQLQNKPAHCWAADESSDTTPWFNDLKEFLKTGSYPQHAAEVEIPSLRILMEAKLGEADWIKQRHEQLTSIDERRFNAICHGQCYQKRVARAYNKKVHRRAFEEGDKGRMKAEAGLHPDHSVEGLRALEFHIKAEKKTSAARGNFLESIDRPKEKLSKGFGEKGV
ncbi:uncharacterized protein LOC113750569 [Coffea eugenioides]|uniref:uncharacterized protein LOC113750569 n=1 Tax=Coffea eugenioides TaxID=49369 RepID=UPI000F60DDB7|nr:uncharacterized protein LOC113750569 [Coffea eugenioides]